jgi:energy-coupling factor transporter ATP-binding protein EcfA2
MPNDLILNSLEIQRFRCFRELRIEHLGRVNLIVGKNNVGKSTVLEALRLFAKPASLVDLLDMLAGRNEISTGEFEAWKRGPEYPHRIDRFFFGRRSTPGEEGAIVIGSVECKDDCLKISLNIREYLVKAVLPPYDKLDCIKAFKGAARESEEEGVLVRLARKGDRTLVGEFDERELEIAVEGEIEVR